MKDNDLLLTQYNLRHLESEQNAKRHGGHNTSITKDGLSVADDMIALFEHLGPANIDIVRIGTLKRHHESAEPVLSEVGYTGKIVYDYRLNAFFSGPLLEQPPEVTEQQFNLKRFKPPEGQKKIIIQLPNQYEYLIDPRAAGIYPFDPLYCAAYVDRFLRNAIFPDDKTLRSFATIKHDVQSLHTDSIDLVTDTKKPITSVSIGSCSPNGVSLEFAQHGTIGEKMFSNFGSENKPIFPQQHNEVSILGYTQNDLEQGRTRLRALEGNVSIQNYIARNQ